MNNQTMAKQLQEFYLDWINNYLTVDKIAEHNDLTAADARILIELGRAYHQERIEAACLMLKHESNLGEGLNNV